MSEPVRRRGRPKESSGPSGAVQSIERALDVLELLAAHQGLTLSEVAEKVALSPSTVHRVLRTLEQRGVVECDPTAQSWHIGAATFRLGAAFMARTGLVERARPVLRRLMEHTGETTNLGVLNGRSVLIMCEVETHQTIRAIVPPGTLSSIHASAIGKVLLAYSTPKTFARLMADTQLQRFTANTLIAPEALQADMTRIRARGFAFDDEERTPGMRCIAAPVFDVAGEVVAGISVSGPSHRIGQSHVKTLGAVVVAAAQELSLSSGS